jgi:hypothetical protein
MKKRNRKHTPKTQEELVALFLKRIEEMKADARQS